MIKKLEIWPEDLKRKEEGRGLGEGASYIPWIGVGEFPNLGNEKSLPGKLIRRLHTTHSQIERAFLEVIECQDTVADIREQYPLLIEETIMIADELVITHPRDFKTKRKRVMTTDFLITRADGQLEAVAIKNSQELQLTRTRQKLEIEQEYWKRRGIPWYLYTEREAGDGNTRNMRWLIEALLFHGAAFPRDTKNLIKESIEERWVEPKTVSGIASEIDSLLGLQEQSIHIIKELIKERTWDWNSYHGLLERDLFRLETHWTGEKVLRAQVPLAGFEKHHGESNLHSIQLLWGRKRNEKLKRHRRELAAAERDTRPPKSERVRKVKIRNPKPAPFQVQVGLLRPLYDELLWSVLCRYYKKMGKPPINPFSMEVWGARDQPGVLVTQYLDKIARHFPESLQLTEERLQARHTLCNFYCHWGPAGKKRPSVTTHLKSCPECRKSDQNGVGIAYWHRIHQIDGATYCLHHGCRLQASKNPSIKQGVGRNWKPVFFSPEDTEWEEILEGNWAVEEFFLTQVRNVLRGKSLPWEKQKQSLWGEMERQGYTRGVMVDGWKVLAEAETRYGSQLKSLFHMENNAWGRRTITNILTGVEPDPHRLLFLHCLLRLPVDVEKPPAKLEPIDAEPRPSRPRVDKTAKARRKEYLKHIKEIKKIEDLPETQEMRMTDPEWMEDLLISRRKKAETQKQWRKELDEELANKIEEASARLKVGEAGLEAVNLERIMREAGDRRILHCLNEPMTAKALESCIDSKDDAVRRRIHWGMENLDTQSYYEFVDKTRLRGIELPEWAVNEIKGFVGPSREENIRQRTEKDKEVAQQVREAAAKMRNKLGRPEWIRLAGLAREVGIKNWGPETEQALKEESDTNESLLQRRIAWAKENFPKGKRMSRYEVRNFLGLRGWRERPDEKKLIDQLEYTPPHENS